MTLTLQSRLFDTIRQELGGTYSIEVSPDAHKAPKPEYTVRIRLDLRPGADHVARAARARRDRVRAEHDVSARPGGSHPRRARREFERNSEDNGYVLNQIARRYADGDTANLSSIVDLQDRIAALTGEEIQEAARTYLNMKSYVKVTLMPEGSSGRGSRARGFAGSLTGSFDAAG